ncbi:MAG: 8-oxoguanine DNA glycosylase [Clostridia bacterium]|nr:8-oxoguanine DNA glycosylase [Clostridia bacterium]
MELAIGKIENGIEISGLVDFDLQSILECGQCFRWTKNSHNDYTGIVAERIARAVQMENTLRLYNCDRHDFEIFWHNYFDMGTDYGQIKKKLTCDDPVMKKAADYAPGIRILRQPLFETLVSFIISANNSIPNIIRVISALSLMYGNKIIFDGREYGSFPEPSVLASREICDIRLSKAGYRCDYIKKTAAMFESNPITTEELSRLDINDARKLLMEFPGVGAKVADCVILFTGAHTEAFPVDVWVRKVMQDLYIGKETPMGEIGAYAQNKFGNLAGYAQQYLFHYIRNSNKRQGHILAAK